jgi:hypothetical protein
LVKVPNTKVVPNNQIYLHAKFHIFMRCLSMSPRFIFHPCVIKIFLEQEKGFFIAGRFCHTGLVYSAKLA